MARKKSAPRDRSTKRSTARRASAGRRDVRPTAEELQGPPPREATLMRSDAELEARREAAQFSETGPNVVDEYGDALGVPRAPEEELRTSQEILEQRDRYRWEQEG